MSAPNGSSNLHGPFITAEVLQSSAAQAGVKVPEKWEADFTELLAGARDALEQVVAMEDFVIQPDLERFPRKDIYRPTPDDNPHNAWATRATVQDTKADEASSAGILAGNTVVLKDNICLAGVPCEFGTKVFEDWVPKTDATVVTRVLEAGGVIIGKATCENFCAYGVSNTAAHGPVGNPYDKTRSAGGSSSGCGVLVAIGEADMAIGGDQGGSIRIPASHVGIVGLKPTYGLVPYTGIISSETLVDHAGPMTRDVTANAKLLQAIAGVDGLDDRQIAGTPYKENVPNYVALLSAARTAHALLSVPEKTPEFAPGMTRKMRLGILKEAESVFRMDPRVAACVRTAARKFEEIGGEVVEVSVPGHAQGGVLGRVQRIMSNNLLGRSGGTRQMYMTDLVEKMLPWTQDKFEKLWFTSSSALVQGLYAEKNYPFLHAKVHNLIRKLKLDYDTALSDVDVLIMPTLPWVAKKLLPKDAPPLEHFNDYNGLVGNTIPFDLSGHPALSIPCGMLSPPEGPDDLRLPVGMQLVGKFQDELTLYKAALAWGDAFDWKAM